MGTIHNITAERGWTPQLVWIYSQRGDRLGLELGRVRSGDVRVVMLVPGGWLETSVAGCRLRTAVLTAAPLADVERLLNVAVEARLIAKCERQALLRQWKRERKAAEAARVMCPTTSRPTYKVRRGSGQSVLPEYLWGIAR